MRHVESHLPLLPLLLADVPRALVELLVQEGVPIGDYAERPAAGRFVLFDSRRTARRATEGQLWIDVARLGIDGRRDLVGLLDDWQSARHEWQIGQWTVTEEIAQVDRRAIRRKIMGRLRDEIEKAGGIWLTVSAYPFPYRSVFNFRIDHDEFDRHDFEATMHALRGRESWTSHFVNGAFYESADAAWDRLRGLDVGSHGYWHHTYRTLIENLRNIRRGIDVAESHGIEPRGFAAPAGRYYPELREALAEVGVSHSGEFALAWDELPFMPAADGPLQVPVHPVCLGLFLEAADRQGRGGVPTLAERRHRAAAAAAEYYETLIADRARAGEPLMLYGHPEGRLGQYPGVLKRILRAVDLLDTVWKTTQSTWVDWWHARRSLRISVTEAGGVYTVAVEHRPEGWDFAVELWRDRLAAPMPLNGTSIRFSPAALAYESRQSRSAVHPVRIDRSEGIKSHLRRAIDWEYITPIGEIDPTGWRNRLKRTLRRWVG